MFGLKSYSAFWQRLKTARGRHKYRFESAINEFRDKLNPHMEEEITRLSRVFSSDIKLRKHLTPIADILRDYLLWLRWNGWLSTQLAPPLQLTGDDDARRLAITLITHMGPRLVDDGIDGHVYFKDKHLTLMGALEQKFPDIQPSVVRCQSVLIGYWVLNYGIRRMRQIGLEYCADNISRLCEITVPGVVAETFYREAIEKDGYEQIVKRKSVAYEMMIYQNFLAPVEPTLRSALLKTLGIMVEIAQYLNDYMHRKDDEKRNQINLINNEFETEKTIWEYSLGKAENHFDTLANFPEHIVDAVAAVAVEIFETSNNLWGGKSEIEKY